MCVDNKQFSQTTIIIIMLNYNNKHFHQEWTLQQKLHHQPHNHTIIGFDEATRLTKMVRTGRIPWHNHEVAVTGLGLLKGNNMVMVDVHVNQPTPSRLRLTIQLDVQGVDHTQHIRSYEI